MGFILVFLLWRHIIIIAALLFFFFPQNRVSLCNLLLSSNSLCGSGWSQNQRSAYPCLNAGIKTVKAIFLSFMFQTEPDVEKLNTMFLKTYTLIYINSDRRMLSSMSIWDTKEQDCLKNKTKKF